MHVSLLSHDEFKSKVGALDVMVRKTQFGQEVSLWSQDCLCALGFGNNEEILADLKSHYPNSLQYSRREPHSEDPKNILLVGTSFQRKVWDELMKIPEGKTATYQDIASRIGNPKAIRAVGTAIGRNQISLHVPCHRVIRSDRSLGGYRWGLEVKKKILAHEGIL